MGEKIAIRAAYGQAIAELGEEFPEIVLLDADVSGSTQSKIFAKKFPERFFNMGIAEANMTAAAAGLAAAGYKPFTNGFAMFAAGRSWEQIRNSVAYPHLNVKIVGSHGGLSVGEDGATHQSVEDLAIMRAIPGMVVLCPCDGYEAKLATRALVEYEGPAFMRTSRAGGATFTDEIEGYTFEIGKGFQIKDGKDVTIIACGLMVEVAIKASEKLAEEGISARVIDMATIKPLDEEIVAKAAKETGCIVTSEEASIIGGLGEAVASYCAENCPVPVIRHGVEDKFGHSGKAQAIMDMYGLNVEGMIAKVKLALSKKA